jgi:hypothetical protein
MFRPATQNFVAAGAARNPRRQKSGELFLPIETACRRPIQLRHRGTVSLEQAKVLMSGRLMLATAVYEGVIS